MPEYGRNKGRKDDVVNYHEVQKKWQKWGDRRAAVSCRELLGNGRNGEEGEAAANCHKGPEKVQTWGKKRREGRGDMRNCQELP